MALNKVLLIGRLGKDPEGKVLSSGKYLSKFPIASDEKLLKYGQMVEKTEWHKITLFGKVAEFAQEYLHKGDQVYIEDKINTDKWEDPNTGEKKFSTQILASRVETISKADATRRIKQDMDLSVY